MSFRNFERGERTESNAERPEKSTEERVDSKEDKKLTSKIKDFFNPDKKKEIEEDKGDGGKEEKEVKSQILKTPETLSEKEKSKVKVERLEEDDKKSDVEKTDVEKADVEKENPDKKTENDPEQKTEKQSPFKKIMDKIRKTEGKTEEKTEKTENKSDVRTPTQRDSKFEAYLQELRDKTEAYQKSDAYKKDQEAREKKKLEKKEETDGDNEDYQRERTLEPNTHGWDRYKEDTKGKDDGEER